MPLPQPGRQIIDGTLAEDSADRGSRPCLGELVVGSASGKAASGSLFRPHQRPAQESPALSFDADSSSAWTCFWVEMG